MVLADLVDLDFRIGDNLFRLLISIGQGRAFADLLTISVSLGGYTITYNLLDLLLILGISIVAAVLVEKLAGQTTPGGMFGAFIIALIGIWVFITFIPLVWTQDVRLPNTHVPLVTSFIGAVLSILVVHLLTKSFRRKPAAKAA